ncbi:MAG: hypothetical protein AVDCRST_MAG68-2312 [uncultured Gemmatimonadetes bacterium]|uniref:CHAT domain-containing protein n=1 Tax=uncultured Gemmatimonadota bacterium TaxID=203437 RepID=A0A6J4LEU7_9BACT|nr:MAG: hypothetical protein AVDCRST_MAG68-2312 [uncultured Gemmatimonadota bacterium]
MRDEIEVLFLASDPFREGAARRLDEEVRGVEEAIRRGHGCARVKLVPCFAPGTRDLQHALMRHDPRIVHFAGDGGGIYLGDASGRRGLVTARALAELFGFLNEWIKVVILNGCDTLPMAEALGEVVDYTIGMDPPLGDASAILFAEAFYGALGMGETVRGSFDEAVRRLDGSAVPVLRTRAGAR